MFVKMNECKMEGLTELGKGIEWMIEWVRVDEWMNENWKDRPLKGDKEGVNEWMDWLMDGLIDEWMDQWVNASMNEWIDKRKLNNRIGKIWIFIHEWMNEIKNKK